MFPWRIIHERSLEWGKYPWRRKPGLCLRTVPPPHLLPGAAGMSKLSEAGEQLEQETTIWRLEGHGESIRKATSGCHPEEVNGLKFPFRARCKDLKKFQVISSLKNINKLYFGAVLGLQKSWVENTEFPYTAVSFICSFALAISVTWGQQRSENIKQKVPEVKNS